MLITMKDWLKQALFMLARKMRVKNVTHYRNDCNYEFQPLLQLSLWKKSGPLGYCTFYAIGRITFCLRTPLVHFSTVPLAAYLRCSPLCEPALASYLSALHEAHKYLTCLLRKLNLFLKATSVGKDRFKIFLLNIKIICPRPQFGIY